MKIEEQMSQLKLAGMRHRYISLTETRQLQNLSLKEGLELLLQAETENRQSRRTERLTTQARFRYQASLSEVSYADGRNLDKNLIASLSDCSFIPKGQSIIITGATGCGKSYLASALGQQACLMGFKVMYAATSKLFQRLKIAQMDGSWVKTMEQIAKQQLLILGDFAITGMDKQQAVDLMEMRIAITKMQPSLLPTCL